MLELIKLGNLIEKFFTDSIRIIIISSLMYGTVTAANTKLQEAVTKRATIRTNTVELRSLRQDLRSEVLKIKSILNSYRLLDTLTDDQISEVQDKIKQLKDARIIIKNEYDKIVTNIKEYQDDTSEEKLTGLDRVIASQEGRITALNSAVDIFK